ncbi:MAG: ribulose-bisphosphate carboxylase large subunit [Candidatus Dojkabacteria bacterium]|nr:ribulose-bisphosphate carboxylase large subunit [Candidatus Dojkabacteria bacterium]
MNYLHLGEEIDPSSYVIEEFYVESDVSLLEVAEALAAESSIGTWTDLTTMRSDLFNRLAARIFFVDDEENIIKIAYPTALFEGGSVPQLLSDVSGNVFGLKEIKNLRVKDIVFPPAYVRSYMGPAFGIEGIRSLLNIETRPLLGTIIKPKVGLSADEHAQVAFDAWVGGIDVVKDDENLTDQVFNPFEERIIKTLEMRKKAEEMTGNRKLYVPNISAPITQMERRAEFVKVQGGHAVMMDILTVGFSGVQHIRNQNYGLILHGHRAMHGAFTHGTRHGIAMLPIARAARLSGIDQLHTGTIIGKMEGGAEQVTEVNDAMRMPWHDLKPTMPIASGGVHPGLIPEMIRLIGNDVIINLGGGIHGHPGGTRRGAAAALQAVQAHMRGVSLEEYAKDHEELAQAVGKWGTYSKPNQQKALVTYSYGLTAT